MKTTSRLSSRIVVLTSILLALTLTTGCAQRVVGTVDVPIGDEKPVYGDTIPLSILRGENKYASDFSAVVKVMSVGGTRWIRGEITSPTSLVGQDPDLEHVVVVLYLCELLSNKADKLSDGTIVYKGDGYPQIILGKLYNVVGVLQPGWQDWPLVYVPTASQITQVSSGD
ncbi:MAG: hypothetical protein Q7V53_07635 [Caldisericota bacterium]|nr:hypothetical protein [Caldisericota bacterium]